MYLDMYVNLISDPHYGVPVIEGVFVLLLLSWLLLFLSKLIFKEFFSNKFWKVAFIIIVAVPSLIEIYIGSINTLTVYPLVNFFVHEEMMGHASVSPFHIVFFPLFLVFTLGYVFNFGLRLIWHIKARTGTTQSNR